MKIQRYFSEAGKPVEQQINWKKVNVAIKDGKTQQIIFQMDDVEVPDYWSDNAAQILANKYFRKAGVPQYPDNLQLKEESGLPGWLSLSYVLPGAEIGSEMSAKQVFHRLAGCWTYWGWKEGLLTTDEDARTFYDETYMMLAKQIGAPNSPQWFNTGLHWAYGIKGPASGQWTVSHKEEDLPFDKFFEEQKGEWFDDVVVYETQNSYERPQPHACFIQPVSDDLVNDGGMLDLWRREARLFKHGSGSGSNMSNIRAKGEPLSGGGKSSGLMSFLRVGDSNAGSIKSGGVTRRAALMRILDLDHPEIYEFTMWKAREEAKAAAMYVGSQIIRGAYLGNGSFDDPMIDFPQPIVDRCNNGFEPEIFSASWEGDAVASVDGQNSNNTVRATNEFMKLVENDGDWNLTARTSGEVMRTVKARDLWITVCRAAWASADPGLQFDTTINEWHTCPVDGRINGSNPCSEYMHNDNTACNLASLNLVSFLRPDGSLDLAGYEHAVRLYSMVLEISVHMAGFPSKEIALGSYNYRTLGLGYANLGGLLMRMGIPYDSDEGRSLAAAITALMTGVAYKTSAEMANEVGPFPRWEANKESMRRILYNHAMSILSSENRVEGLSIQPYRPDIKLNEDEDDNNIVSNAIASRAYNIWCEGVLHGAPNGFRNAQTTLIAPTGTISFVMDCCTTGIEPDFGLVKHKSLAGGGHMKIVNQSIPLALRSLGYDEQYISRIVEYVEKFGKMPVESKQSEGFVALSYGSGHEKVFDCANDIDPMGHVKMVAAVQPFLSGAVSKTINMPHDATVEDVSDVYTQSWKLGLKAVALYRDGSKLTQPYASQKKKDPVKEAALKTAKTFEEQMMEKASSNLFARRFTESMQGSTIKTHVLPNGHDAPNGNGREMLPWRREKGFTQKVKIDGQSVYLHVGEYEDGRPGEIFLELAKQGSTLRGMGNLFAISVSIGLQHGVPVREYIKNFLHTKFEPAGIVEGHKHIKMVSSIADYVARELAITYLKQYDLASDKTGLGEGLESLVVTATPSGMEQVGASVSGLMTSTIVARTGGICPECHNATLVQNGTCTSCSNCLYNTGCG